jgi:hypothetical protein
MILLISASSVARITAVSHHTCLTLLSSATLAQTLYAECDCIQHEAAEQGVSFIRGKLTSVTTGTWILLELLFS